MKDAEKLFSEMVSDRLEALGMNAYGIEKLHGFPEDTIRSLLRSDSKRSHPNLNRVKAICDVLGLELYFGPPRDTGPVEVASSEDFAQIPLHAALLSAGPGAENGAADIVDHLAFRRDWLRKIGVAPSNACLARVCGDSMRPTMFPGDLVLVDTAKREIAPRKAGVKATSKLPIYALIEDGHARVKRIDRPSEDMLVLISDNPDNPPEVLTGADARAVNIIGKVLWWGHTASE